MKLIKFNPHPLLRKFIEFYYIVESGPDQDKQRVPLFVNAGADILVNCSSSPLNFKDVSLLMPYQIYMNGTANSAYFVESFPNSTFVGVRFRPGGLSVFYNIRMIEISNKIIEFQDRHFCGLIGIDEKLPQRLDHFYLSKCASPVAMFTPIIDAVLYYNGNITVEKLANQCNISQRSLERLFDANIGVRPKEFINSIRFQRALKELQNGCPTGRMHQIAYELGYYDLSHFANDFKKHSGITPSKIGQEEVSIDFFVNSHPNS